MAMAVTIPTISSATPTDCSTLTVPFSGTVNGGLTVSDNDNCQLSGATIHGGIDMTGGTLLVCESKIDGGIDVSGGSKVQIGDADHSPPCSANRINGNSTVSGVVGVESGTNAVEFGDNLMNGGLDLFNNGPTEVEGNDIQGPLNCGGNSSVSDDGVP